MWQGKDRPKMCWLRITRSHGALMRTAESVKQACPVIETSGLRLGSIKIRTNRSPSNPLGNSEVPVFVTRVENHFEIRWYGSQRDKWFIGISPPRWAPIHRFIDSLVNFFRRDKDRGFEFYCTTGVGY